MEEIERCSMEKEINFFLHTKSLSREYVSDRYEVWLRRLDQFTQKKINDYTESDLLLFAQHIKGKVKGGIYKPKTYEYCMRVIRSYFGFWYTRNKEILDPKVIEVPVTRADSHNPLLWEDYLKVKDFYSRNEYRTLQKNLLCRMLWDTKTRVSELLSIDIDDLNTSRKFAIINSMKTRKKRRIFWSEETNKILVQEYLPIRVHLKRSPALFIGLYNTGKCSKRLNARTVQRMCKELEKKLEIPYSISPHSFRHGAAHHMLNNGASVAAVANILGHLAPQSSHIYLQYAGEEEYELAQKYLE